MQIIDTCTSRKGISTISIQSSMNLESKYIELLICVVVIHFSAYDMLDIVI
jgi:hypothetical protein